MDVLENERLTGDGWVANFCSANKIKEFRRHGEAGSVDLVAVATFDESGLFPFAPPGRGLATKQGLQLDMLATHGSWVLLLE